MRRDTRSNAGAALVEYALLLALISLAAITSIERVGAEIERSFASLSFIQVLSVPSLGGGDDDENFNPGKKGSGGGTEQSGM